MAAQRGSLTLAGAALVTAALVAQQPAPPQTPLFRSGIDVVEVDASATHDGAAITGLTAANFVLLDNGVPQQVTSVRLDTLPLSVMLLLDTSSSVAGEKLSHLIAAGHLLVRSLHPEDGAALITFSHEVTVRVPLTHDLGAIESALAGLGAHGATSLDDAVHVALQLRPLDKSRTVLLLFTDGRDTASFLSADEVVEETRRAGVVIHAIELHDRQGASPVLDRLARASGGRIWSATAPRDLQSLFTKALEEMRARYLLTFTPQGVGREGWHNLSVTLKGVQGDVRARPAYFVAPAGK